MSGQTFLSSLAALPQPADPDAASRGLESWRERAAETEDPALAAFAAALADDDAGSRLLKAVFGSSPFLSHALLQEMAFCRTLFNRGPDITFADLTRAINDQLTGESDRSEGVV